MSARRIFFLARHGETDWNALGRWQGQTDIPLNDVGRAQARGLAARLRGEGIVSVGSSDLSRARETAEIASSELGLAAGYVDAAFRERAYGIFEGLTRDECIARYPEEWNRFTSDPRAELPGVELLAALAGRMLIGIRHAAARPGHPTLIVSHGRAIRALVGLVLGADVPPIPNGAVYRIVVEHGGDPVEAALVT
jgi:broad specificity phosphatase PhoE